MYKILTFSVLVLIFSATSFAIPIYIPSIDAQDGMLRCDAYFYSNAIRMGDDGYARVYQPIMSFDTSVLSGKTIVSAKLVLTKQGSLTPWGQNPAPDPDSMQYTLDIKSGCFGLDCSSDVEYATDCVDTADCEDCSEVSPLVGFTAIAASPGVQIEVPLSAAGIAAINTSGMTQIQFRDAVSTDNGADRSDADAIDFASSPLLVVDDGVIAPLLEEHFDSDTIDTSVWSVTQNPSAATPLRLLEVPAGSGDYALEVTNSSANYTAYMFSQQSFPRGDNLRASFRIWNPDWNSGPNVGFYDSTTPSAYQHFAGTIAYQPVLWQFQDNGFDNAWGQPRLTELETYYTDVALDRGGLLKCRVWIDDTQGSYVEYSFDGGATWQMDPDGYGDTRVGAAQEDRGGTANPVWFGFCPMNAGRTYIDDIIIQTDSYYSPVDDWYLY